MKIYKDDKVIIVGKRDPTNGLWSIPITPHAPTATPPATDPQKRSSHSANSTINNSKTKADAAAFLHGCSFSPKYSTFLRAIQHGHYSSWPGLTALLITKHLPSSRTTSLGHLRMQQKHVRSTMTTSSLPIETSLDVCLSQEPNNARTHAVFATILTTMDLRKSYSDQTGKFPEQSSRGFNYVMILYNYDSNNILSTPLRTRQASEITAAWEKLHTRVETNGYAPELRILDNECSA